MKVNDAQNVAAVPDVANSSRRADTAAAPADAVSVSSQQALQNAVSQAQAQASPGRQAEIEKIAAAVKSGTYAPDPSRIAEQILSAAELDAHLEALLK
jgi:anti-sigma28 factor (negative regulator of flagellin synthesis)